MEWLGKENMEDKESKQWSIGTLLKAQEKAITIPAGLTPGKEYFSEIGSPIFYDDYRCSYKVDDFNFNKHLRSVGSLMGRKPPKDSTGVGLVVRLPVQDNLTIGKEYFYYSETSVRFIDDAGQDCKISDFVFMPVHIEQSASIALKPTGPLSDDPLVNPKKAAGQVKAPMHTLPTIAMIQMANVMAGGAHKYGYHNFRESQVDAQTYIGAMNRHFLKWQDGVDLDEESGMHELAHLMACCAIMIDAHFTGKLIDNRSKTGLIKGLLEDSKEEFGKFIKENKSIGEKNADQCKSNST